MRIELMNSGFADLPVFVCEICGKIGIAREFLGRKRQTKLQND